MITTKDVSRVDYIDRLKGITIILVVMGHIIQYNIFNGQATSLYSMIYSFHMPLFMFISGYVLQKFFKINFLIDSFSFIWKKSRALLLPLFGWAAIHTIFNNSVDFTLPIKVYHSVVNQIIHPNLWFLHTLFLLMLFYLLFYWISFFLNKNKHFTLDGIIYIILLSSIAIVFKLFFNNFPMSLLLYSVFFMFAVFLIRYNRLLELIQNNIINSFSLLLLILLIGTYNFNESNLFLMKGLKIIISFTAIIVLYNLTKENLFPKIVDNFLIKCGRSSLAIYVIHFSFVHIHMFSFNTNLLFMFLTVLLISIIIVIPIFFIEKVIKIFPYISFILLGTPLKKGTTLIINQEKKN